MNFSLRMIVLGLTIGMSGCASAYHQNSVGVLLNTYERIYLTDYNTAWTSVLDAFKSSPLDETNREGGFIRTKWIDNTAERNFVDSFGGQDLYLKAQVRFRVTVAKGFYQDRPSIKIAVQKEQAVQRDVLEGWRPVETDGVEERTLLYRIGRIMNIRMRMSKLEEDRVNRELENADF